MLLDLFQKKIRSILPDAEFWRSVKIRLKARASDGLEEYPRRR